jgi:HD domain-containing protein
LAPLFLQLPTNDQRHGLDVLLTVTGQDAQASRLLQQAALLHDLGKGGTGFSVLERSLTVFLQAVAPGVLRWLFRARPGFARRYTAYADHARLGAEQVRAAGSPELAAIIAEHHLPDPQSEVTRRLKQADVRN